MTIQISHLDHWVLTVRDVEATAAFYVQVLGMERVMVGKGRLALRFGQQKINLHPIDAEIHPRARVPQPGTADLCLQLATSLEAAMTHLQVCGVERVAGPVERTGAVEPLMSIYLRDPDGNLVELAVPRATCF